MDSNPIGYVCNLPIKKKMEWPFLMKRFGRVAWFGHVHRKVIYAPMRKSELIQG